MNPKIKYEFRAKLWKSKDPGAWYFVSLPIPISKEIRENLQWQEEGWGRMKADAAIGDLKWETAIWFDTKAQTYILPIKAAVRNKAKVLLDEMIQLTIWI